MKKTLLQLSLILSLLAALVALRPGQFTTAQSTRGGVWNGGTVSRPTVFTGSVTFNGSVSGLPSSTWNGGVVTNPATFRGAVTFNSGGTPDFTVGANFSGGTFDFSGGTISNLNASGLTGTLPALNGVNLTNLNASDLSTGTVGTARLGSGSATSSTFLRGDGTWNTPIASWNGGTVSDATTFSSSVTTSGTAGLRIGSGAVLKNSFSNDVVFTSSSGGSGVGHFAKSYTNSTTYEVLQVGWNGVAADGYTLQSLFNGGGEYWPITISPSNLSAFTFDTDASFHPRTDGSNSIGTAAKRFGTAYINTVNATTITIGTSTWTVGSGAPSGACNNGSLYTRTDATGGLYLCVNAAWVAK